jgi:N-methylhydantoinase B
MAAINPMSGGSGGTKLGDGTDGSGANAGFLKNSPVEVNEVEAGIRVHSYGLSKDSGGPGKHRGGLGTDFVFEALSPNTKVTARNRDRTRFAGWGISEGKAGGPSKFIRNPNTEKEFNLRNTDILSLDPGDTIHVTCGGAGGWGNALDRDPESVLLDAQRNWVSLEQAEKEYGVVITRNKDGLLELDKKRTKKLRDDRNAKRITSNSFYNLCDARVEYEKRWNKTNYDQLTDCLAKLPVTWRFYTKHRIFAAIDKWDESDTKLFNGQVVSSLFSKILDEFPELKG